MSCMKQIVLILGAVCLVLLLAVAGCSQPAQQQATPVPTPVPTTQPVTTVATPVPTTFVPETPGPTQTLPANYAVSVDVRSNGQSVNPQVIFTFEGGMGMNLVPEIDVQLTKSDGTVEIGNFTLGNNMAMGQTVSLPGSTGNNDRAQVWVITPNQQRVKIVDKLVPFRSYS